MTIQITKPEIEALITQRLKSGRFKDAEDVIFQALKLSGTAPQKIEAERAAAIERLKTFGKRHGLSLGGITIRELRDEARP
jgi:Arc/MetJ-type ribon-helix-helix transcriptional regulator